MESYLIPLLLMLGAAAFVAVGMLLAASVLGPRQRITPVKQMPYESGMDPLHDARRRFDVRFHLVAIAFLIFDVELLFIYPWAVASGHAAGIDRAVADGWVNDRLLVLGGVAFFLALVVAGLVYEWRRGVLRWR